MEGVTIEDVIKDPTILDRDKIKPSYPRDGFIEIMESVRNYVRERQTEGEIKRNYHLLCARVNTIELRYNCGLLTKEEYDYLTSTNENKIVDGWISRLVVQD